MAFTANGGGLKGVDQRAQRLEVFSVATAKQRRGRGCELREVGEGPEVVALAHRLGDGWVPRIVQEGGLWALDDRGRIDGSDQNPERAVVDKGLEVGLPVLRVSRDGVHLDSGHLAR